VRVGFHAQPRTRSHGTTIAETILAEADEVDAAGDLGATAGEIPLVLGAHMRRDRDYIVSARCWRSTRREPSVSLCSSR
jgi:hypothetical protein